MYDLNCCDVTITEHIEVRAGPPKQSKDRFLLYVYDTGIDGVGVGVVGSGGGKGGD